MTLASRASMPMTPCSTLSLLLASIPLMLHPYHLHSILVMQHCPFTFMLPFHLMMCDDPFNTAPPLCLTNLFTISFSLHWRPPSCPYLVSPLSHLLDLVTKPLGHVVAPCAWSCVAIHMHPSSSNCLCDAELSPLLLHVVISVCFSF